MINKKRKIAQRKQYHKTQPPELHPLHPKRDALGFALLFIGTLILYAISTPRTTMLEDDGGFIATAQFASVAHAPGYPLFIILGWFASLLPVGSIAWRVHMASGLMGALTCVCIAWFLLRQTGNRPAAYLAGAALAVSEHFWSQAIIADVYTTNAALLFLALVLVQAAVASKSTRLWVSAAIIYGLGLANHYPLLILGSPILLAYAMRAKKDFWNRIYYLVPIAGLVAAALYGWMVWRSHQPTPINFFGPISSWGEFFSFVDRSIYAGVDSSVNAGLLDKLLYTKYLVTQVLLQFSVVGGMVALWGLFASYRAGWRLESWGEMLAFASSSFLLIALLGFDYDPLMIAAFRPYPLVAYGILALWLGYGIHACSEKIRRQRLLIYSVSALTVVMLGLWNGRINYRPHDTFAADQAQAILDLVEEDGVIVLYQDAYIGPMAYLRWVAGQRPDVRMLEAHGLLFNDRVVQPSWTQAQRDTVWTNFFRSTQRPSYFQWRGDTLSGVGQVHLGFLRRADKAIKPGNISIDLNDTAKAFFQQLIAMPKPADAWVAYHRNQMLETYGEFLGLAQASDHAVLNDYVKDILPLAESNYWSLMGMVGALAPQGSPRALRLAEAFLKKAKQVAGDDRSKAQRAVVFYLEGLIEQQKGKIGRARALFQASLKMSRAPSNQSYQALKALRPAPRQAVPR